eukprot:6153827-Pleurochrysis_carterae.AAC.1
MANIDALQTPSLRSSESTTLGGGRIADPNEIAKLKSKIKELKEAVQRKEKDPVMARAEITTFDSRMQLAVKKTELKMRDKMEEAYKLGRVRAFKQLKEAKAFTSN